MALGSTTARTATIVDDDEAPVITSNGGGSAANISVAENSSTVTTVAATDADGDSLVYTIVAGGDGGQISLDPATHQLSFKTAPDFENPTDANHDNIYDVTVQVSDGSNTDTQVLHVSVTDVNGVTITGTNKKDKVDATNSVGSQSKPTGEEDVISGKAKNDKLSGLGGNDVLIGGNGADKLRGDDGADAFRFDVKLNQPADKVLDFDSAEGDFIQLDSFIFGKLSSGVLSDAQFDKFFDYSKGKLSYQGDHFATFSGKPVLDADDFIVI